MTGVPVTVKGQIIGRGTPGYVLSPDLVVADASGFVPLLYRQPIPFATELFGLFRAEGLSGPGGRGPGLVPSLARPRDRAARGHRHRRPPGPGLGECARYAAAVLLIVAGVGLMLVGVV